MNLAAMPSMSVVARIASMSMPTSILQLVA
jgi:hypothetical protein